MLRTIASVLLFITATAYAMAPTSEGQACGVSGNVGGSAYCLYCSKGDPTATSVSFGDDISCTCAGDVPCAVLINGKAATMKEYEDLVTVSD